MIDAFVEQGRIHSRRRAVLETFIMQTRQDGGTLNRLQSPGRRRRRDHGDGIGEALAVTLHRTEDRTVAIERSAIHGESLTGRLYADIGSQLNSRVHADLPAASS